MNPVRIIERKRDNGEHTAAELEWIVRASLDGSMKPEQISAWLMAVNWRGMSDQETIDFTLALASSGERVDLTGLPHPWCDKHSTGGVGDKMTLVLLPIMAACGLTVVKMSGRGLGITGGTIDKLESIPGFRTSLSLGDLKAQALSIGLALTGQTPNLAPADGVLYALRDVTGTVPSIPLIASSVMSKKIAGGAEKVSIDLKVGCGAFMHSVQDASELARRMKLIGEAAGVDVSVELTDMDQPLGRCVGNALEVQEAIEFLEGAGNARMRELATRTVSLFCVAPEAAEHALDSGLALEKFHQWVKAQDGHCENLTIAPVKDVHRAKSSGWVSRVEAGVIGQAVVDLGGGRTRKEDTIDHSVGIEVLVEVGERVEAGQDLLRVRGSRPVDLAAAVQISESPVSPRPILL